jgi:Putative auto-transporter adhesin, head GIN domain
LVASVATRGAPAGIVAPSHHKQETRTMQIVTPRRFIVLALAAALAAAAHAAPTGSGTAATQSREASGFSAIAVRGDIDVVVRQGSREAVQVSADDNLIALLETVVEGSGDKRTLRISWPRGESIKSRSKTVVTVDLIRLDSVSMAGSGDFTSATPLKTPALSLAISGSSDAHLPQLDTDKLRLSIAGSGDVKAAGRAAELSISIAGSGDVMARDLASDEVSVSIAGSGDASVRANKSISVSIAGSGDVEYAGSGTVAKSRVAGSGAVRHRP